MRDIAEEERRSQPQVSVEATPVAPPQGPQSGAVLFVFALLAVGLSLAYRSWRAGKEAPDFHEPVDTFQQNPQESQEYKVALARTRQAVSVQKAIQLKNEGSQARAMVELERALQENSICREPMFSGLHDAREIRELYQMHVRSTTVPPNYAVLLQLRDMLELPARDAEALEAEVLGSGASFSI
ncbi:hypothetical protein WJX81_000480 [Elliptochloris bilobata]|uniref:Uncharacterized protein n=1 Tax=Elliptochloris bilobata TaxID=381761 RepID=A0AAW1QJR6_9CHLO